MDSWKWTKAILEIISVSVFLIEFDVISTTKSQMNDFQQTFEAILTTGENVELVCGNDQLDQYWTKDNEIVAMLDQVMIHDNRFELANNSTILKIFNVTLNDEGVYKCLVNSTPKYENIYTLYVREMSCKPPEWPIFGSYKSEKEMAGEMYKSGDKIQYFCSAGYRLVGKAIRICSGKTGRWTNEEPYCESELLVQLKQKLNNLDEIVTNVNDKVTANENKVNSMENRLSTIEIINSTARNNVLLSSEMDAARERLWRAGEIGVFGLIEDSLVSEFTWTVTNIEEKIAQKAAGKFDHRQSKPFYVNVPGYRFRLYLYPDDDGSGYLGVYIGLVQGEFDSQLSWPFDKRIEITSTDRNGNRYADHSISASTSKCRSFRRPPVNNTASCGFHKYANAQTLLYNKNLYLYDGDLIIKTTIYLNSY